MCSRGGHLHIFPPLTEIQGHLKINWGNLLNNILPLFKNNKYTYLGLQDMSNCHKHSNNKTIRHKSTDSVSFNKKQTENINQTIIFNFILIYLCLFLVIIFSLTIITYFLIFLNNSTLYLLMFCVCFNLVQAIHIGHTQQRTKTKRY